jgi:hypothetical protein
LAIDKPPFFAVAMFFLTDAFFRAVVFRAVVFRAVVFRAIVFRAVFRRVVFRVVFRTARRFFRVFFLGFSNSISLIL